MEAILQEWEEFAESIQPISGSMSKEALRNDTKALMEEVADELETPQSKYEQAEKSKGHSLLPPTGTAAGHGLERMEAGFGIDDVINEYRAVRATVVRLWEETRPQDQIDLNDLIRFNEAIDQRIHESVISYARESETRARQLVHAEKLAEVGKLSASIVHELSNPLQVVMTFLKGLRKTPDAIDNQLLDAVISETYRMKSLMRNLNELNRLSSNKKVLMEVNATIDSLLLLGKSSFKRRGVTTVLHYAEKLPRILAVPDQIKQVILNLLSNAMDACQDGGVITISTWQEEGKVAVSIKDNGRGISPDQMDLLFQPFQTTKPAGKGTGLGLSVSKDIIQKHQGEIRVESEPGEGSVFTVLLPIHEQ